MTRARRSRRPSSLLVLPTLARVSAAVLLLATTLGSAAASAQTLPTVQLERFQLQDGLAQGLGAATGDVVDPGGWKAFGALHYERAPLVLVRDGVRLGALVDHKVTLQLGGSFGLSPWLTGSVALPVVAFQGGDDLSAQGFSSPGAFGVGSPWVGVRARLLAEERGALLGGGAPVDLAVGLGTALPLGLGSVLAQESGFTLVPDVSLGRNLGRFRVGGQVAALMRSSAQSLTTNATPLDEVGNQLLLAALVSTTGDGPRVELSARTLVPLAGGRTPAGGEALLGARWPFRAFELFALAGPGFGQLPGTPTFRVLFGVAAGPAVDPCAPGRPHSLEQCPEGDEDRDGVPNAKDACPTKAEDLDGFQDEDGCPDPDNDGDGIPDAQDRCPLQRGSLKRLGCPLGDADKDGIDDDRDQCPAEPGPPSLQGCPPRDSDKDGVTDDVDACPTQPGPASRKGCPE